MIGKILKGGSFGSKVDYEPAKNTTRKSLHPTLGRYSAAVV